MKGKWFPVGKGVFVGLGPRFRKVGQLTDVGTDGLAFQYISNSQASTGSYVDIFTLKGDLFLSKLPIEIVSDAQIVEKASSSSMTVRRCCVTFKGLTPLQKADLEKLIKDYAIGEA